MGRGGGPQYAPPDPSLPAPWKGLMDNGVVYYWNPETNVTQYDRPTAGPARGADTGPPGTSGGSANGSGNGHGLGGYGGGAAGGPKLAQLPGGSWGGGGYQPASSHGAPGTAASAADVAAYKAQHEITVIVSPCLLRSLPCAPCLSPPGYARAGLPGYGRVG